MADFIYQYGASIAFLIVLVFAYIYLVLKFPPAILIANVVFSATTKNVSNLYLEMNQIYLTETAIYTGWNGSTLRQLFYNLSIIIPAVLVLKFSDSKLTKTAASIGRKQFRLAAPKDIQLSLIFASALLLIQILNVLSSPNVPLLPGGHGRQFFWTHDIRYPFLRDTLGVLLVFVPAVASYVVAWGWISKNKKAFFWGLTLAFSHLGFLVLTGQKFNGLLVALAFLSGGGFVLLSRYGLKLNFRKVLLLGSIVFVVVLLISLVGFSDRQISQGRGGVLEGILYRIFGVQGGVYYTTDKFSQLVGGRASLGILFGDMDQLIKIIVPNALAERYIYAGVNLAGSLPGSAALSVGFAGAAFICMAYGLILGFGALLLHKAILHGRIISIFLLSYLNLWLVVIYSRGSFDELLSAKAIIFLVLIFGLEIASRNRDRKIQGVRSRRYT